MHGRIEVRRLLGNPLTQLFELVHGRVHITWL